MKDKDEKTILLRFNLKRRTDREIWDWLHEKSERQSLSMNAYLIDGLRKLMAQDEKPLDVRALAEEICRELRSQGLFVSPAGDGQEAGAETEVLSDDALDFANSF